MSKSIPFLTRPEKLDGSMPGDMGFDPMGLAGIQLPGEQFTEAADPFAAVAKVGFLGNVQIFLAIGVVELINFNKYYGDGTPGDLGWGSQMLSKMTDEQKKYRM